MNVFDIVGPIMIGPSSSHTAGAVRIGKVASSLLKNRPVSAHILLFGSFAKTYKGHGTDKALVAGILKMDPSDARIKNSLAIAKEEGLDVVFEEAQTESDHPNTALITLKDADGETVELQGCSVGGGNIVVNKINGMSVSVSCHNTTIIVIHKDIPGVIANVTSFVAKEGFNICNFSLSREKKGGTAVMTIEIDGGADLRLNDDVAKLPNVIHSTMLSFS